MYGKDFYTSSLFLLALIFIFLSLNTIKFGLRTYIYFGSFFAVIGFIQKPSFGFVNQGDATLGLSNTAYFGFSPSRAIWYLLIITVAALFLNLVMQQKFHQSVVLAGPDFTIPPVIPYVLSILYSLQYFLQRVDQISNKSTDLTWDVLNNVTWANFFSNGLFPMRDFWYPYGGMIYLSVGYFGAVFSTLILFLLSYVSANNIIKTRIQPIYKLSLILLIINTLFMDPVTSMRYGLPILALTYWAIAKSSSTQYVASSLLLGLTFFLSQEVTLISSFLFVFLSILNFKRFVQDGIKIFLFRFALPLLSLFLNAFFLHANGALVNTWQFLFNPKSSLALVSSIDYGLGSDYPVMSSSAILVILIFLLAILSLRLNFIKDFSKFDLAEFVPSFISVVFLAYFLEKELTRGGMLLPACLAFLPALISQYSINTDAEFRRGIDHKRSSKNFFFSVLIPSGVLGLVLFFSGFLQNMSATITNLPSMSRQTFQAHPDLGVYFLRNKYTDPIVTDSEVKSAEEAIGRSSFERLYVLGDHSTFYWNSDRNKYWTITNWALLEDQKKTLNILLERKPDFVYFDYSEETINLDRVPAYLRSPFIYRWVISNYRLYEKLKEGDLLKRIDSGANIDYNYWIGRLGKKVELNYLGYATSSPRPCIDLKECEPYLIVSADEASGPRSMTILCGDNSFELSYKIRNGKNFYFPLSRLWFWNDACTPSRPNNSNTAIALRRSLMGDQSY